MKLAIGNIYMDRTGRLVKITKEVFSGILLGEYEDNPKISERFEAETGTHWNYYFPSRVFSNTAYSLIEKDSIITRIRAFFLRKKFRGLAKKKYMEGFIDFYSTQFLPGCLGVKFAK